MLNIFGDFKNGSQIQGGQFTIKPVKTSDDLTGAQAQDAPKAHLQAWYRPQTKNYNLCLE